MNWPQLPSENSAILCDLVLIEDFFSFDQFANVSKRVRKQESGDEDDLIASYSNWKHVIFLFFFSSVQLINCGRSTRFDGENENGQYEVGVLHEELA